MKTLIVGGAGFVGSNLAEMLIDSNEVVVFDNFSSGNINNLRKFIGKGGVVVQGDILDNFQLKKVMSEHGIEQVYHLAATSSSQMFDKNLKKAIKTNILGTFNVFKTAMECKVKKVCYASTSTVYAGLEPPSREDDKVTHENWYTSTKLTNEFFGYLFARDFNLPCVGFRFFSVYGPNDAGKGKHANMITQFMLSMKKGEQPIVYDDGKQTRDFVWVEDVCRALIAGMNNDVKEGVYNVGTGISTNMIDLVDELNKVLGTDIKPKFANNPIKGYVTKHQAFTFKINTELGWKPEVMLSDGLNRLKEFYK
jgi:UDP-glucose 4-epimerase